MIRVVQQPEYPGFDSQVRKPGAAFLASCPNPNSDQFKKKNLWSKAAKELHAAYSGICAYTAMYLTEQGSVDHFLPKATHPHLAYEWSNYRLAGGRINNAKGNLVGIVDPFQIQNGWFFLDIPSCLIKPNPALQPELRAQIASTINSLRLNQDDSYVQERCSILMDYASGNVSNVFLQKRYPFLASEVSRQGLQQAALKVLFKI